MQDKFAVDQNKASKPAIIAMAMLVALTILAAVFYRERMLFTDASFVAFRRINLGDLESSQRRYGAYITEAVPLILAKLHLPLRIILIAYSLSFNIFYLAVAGIAFRYRQYRLVIVMACYYTLFVSSGYFWTNNEIHQAIAWLMLCSVYTIHAVQRGYRPVAVYLPYTLLLAIAITTHPLLGIAFIFLFIFLILDKTYPLFTKTQTGILGSIAVVLIVIKLVLSNTQSYDARRMGDVLHLNTSSLSSAFSTLMAYKFYEALLKDYWWGALMLLIGIFEMLRRKLWLQCAWVMCAFTGLFLLVSLAFGSYPNLYYLEGEWQIFGIIAATPFVWYCLPKIKPRLQMALLAAVFATRIIYICAAAPPFIYRVQFIEGLLAAMRSKGLKKVIINAREGCPENQLFLDWGLATESTTLSALDGEYPQRTVCALWSNQPQRFPTQNNEMVWNFVNRPAALLNPVYFAIDTTVPYVRIDYETLTGKSCGH